VDAGNLVFYPNADHPDTLQRVDFLKNLPRGHMVMKTGTEHWQQIIVPRVDDPEVSYSSLYDRCRERWAQRRSQVDEDIASRSELIQRVREY